MEKWVSKKKLFFHVNAQLSSIEVFSYHEIKFCIYIYIYISGLDVSPSGTFEYTKEPLCNFIGFVIWFKIYPSVSDLFQL